MNFDDFTSIQINNQEITELFLNDILIWKKEDEEEFFATFRGTQVVLGNINAPIISSENPFISFTDDTYIADIDWEDGVIESIDGSVKQTSHTYADGLDTHTISFSKKVEMIGVYCFIGCNNLISINIPSSVTSLGVYCFNGCTGLTDITIPSSVTSLGGYCFGGCSGLTDITIPSSVTSLGASCFQYCTGLTDITIPSSVTSLGSGCFQNCTGLISITIPSSITSLGGNSFTNCTNLTNVTIPSGVTSLGGSCFRGCTGLTDITIPSSVTSLGASCFQNCTGLTNIPILSGVTSLGSSCFRSCTGLTDITIPSNITSLGSYCFRDCTGLNSVTIPSSVTSLGNYCFNGCTNLIEYNLNWTTSDSIVTYNSSKMPNNTDTVFNIPYGTTDLYIAKNYPSDKLVENHMQGFENVGNWIAFLGKNNTFTSNTDTTMTQINGSEGGVHSENIVFQSDSHYEVSFTIDEETIWGDGMRIGIHSSMYSMEERGCLGISRDNGQIVIDCASDTDSEVTKYITNYTELQYGTVVRFKIINMNQSPIAEIYFDDELITTIDQLYWLYNELWLYAQSWGDGESALVITDFKIVNIPKKMSNVEIIWDDNDNTSNLRPPEVYVTSSYNDTRIYLSENNGWKGSIEVYPSNDYSFSWSIQTITGYRLSKTIEGDTTIFTLTRPTSPTPS